MKNIGKYNGIPCYTCTNTEWHECYRNGSDNGKQIFIIDGIMVCKNKIVGHYDGQHVKDRYDEQPYYIDVKVDNHDVMNMPKQRKAETAREVSYASGCDSAEKTETAVSYEEVVAQEIRFSDYSKIVDEFFALLEV